MMYRRLYKRRKIVKNKPKNNKFSRKWLVSLQIFPFSLKISRFEPKMLVFDASNLRLSTQQGIKLAVTDEEWDTNMLNMRYSMLMGYKILGGVGNKITNP